MTLCGLGRRRHDGGGVTVLLRGGLRLRQGRDGAQPLVQAGLLLQHSLKHKYIHENSNILINFKIFPGGLQPPPPPPLRDSI